MKMYQVMKDSIITQYTEENFYEKYPEAMGKNIHSFINEREELSLWREYELEERYSIQKLRDKIESFSNSQEREAEAISIDGQRFELDNMEDAVKYYWAEISRGVESIYLEVHYAQEKHELPIENTEFYYKRTFVDDF
jgi:hypothetical protein